ncbi:MbnP family copper-binding protein, partial [Thalassolituus sp.]|uniref:MbnP family copper-binding protein n=1 Tax=Thalassolituus sp. TaxID=2030822 RepID=UPI0027D60C83
NPNFNDGVQVTATVEEGVTISAIRFTLGVPFDLNHKDQAAADEPLRNPGRASGAGWNWQGGYKFTGIDVAPVGGWTDPQDGERTGNRWNMHLGSTGCPVSVSDLESGTEPETCENPNRPEITIELGAIDVEQAEIVIDYAALVSGVSVAQDEGGAPGCMSGTTDPECGVVFANLGLGLDLGAGENAESEQSVFSVREKASAE